MKNGRYQKAFVYFLSVSFLLMMNGFPGAIAQAKEIGLPIGEMVSRGEVKFEVRDKVWKNVDLSHFPIFPLKISLPFVFLFWVIFTLVPFRYVD
jgi:hypothetical protein